MSSRVMGRRGVVWKTPDVTADGLKIFACAAMLIAAIGVVIIENGMIHVDQYTQETLSAAMAEDSHLMMLAGISSVMQLMGGMALPVFAFLLVEGFKNTSSYKRYLASMTVFALISEIPYDLAWRGRWLDFSSQNALVTMVICLLLVYFLDMVRSHHMAMAPVLYLVLTLAGILWAAMFRAQYGLGMVLLTAVFYVFDLKNGVKTLLGVIVSLMYVTGPISFYGIWCYNGVRKDRLPKYAYFFLPPSPSGAGIDFQIPDFLGV